MKTAKFVWMLVLVVISMTQGCKKDDDAPEGNYLEYDGKRYALAKGFLENYGLISPGVYDVDISLLSNGFNVVVEDGEVVDITGKGSGIYLDFRTVANKAVPTGTYTFDELSEGAGVIVYGDVLLDYDIESEEGIELLVTGGTVKVTRNGNEYELEFNLVVNGTDTLRGKFKGILSTYDYE